LHNQPNAGEKESGKGVSEEKWKTKAASTTKLWPVTPDGSGANHDDAKAVTDQLEAILTIASEISNLAGKVALKAD
jgi:hypothetical protein